MPHVEGTASLPVDQDNLSHEGIYVDALNAAAGGYLDRRGTPKGSQFGLNEKGTRTHFAVAPTNTATLILAANPPTASISGRLSAQFINWGSVTVYIGKDINVTTVTGTPIPQFGTWSDNDGTEAWYGITASGTGDVRGWAVNN